MRPCVHLAEEILLITVLGGAGATLLARHLACALDAGLLGLSPAERAADFIAGAKAVRICPVRWRVLVGEPTVDDLQTATFVVTDDPACALQISTLRPSLFSCPTPRRGSIGTNVSIAWDGSSGAGRAVRAVRPLLRDARHIRILVTPGANPAGTAKILEEHGILARIGRESDPSFSAAHLREEVEADEIDLIVSARAPGGLPAWSDPLPYLAFALLMA